MPQLILHLRLNLLIELRGTFLRVKRVFTRSGDADEAPEVSPHGDSTELFWEKIVNLSSKSLDSV